MISRISRKLEEGVDGSRGTLCRKDSAARPYKHPDTASTPIVASQWRQRWPIILEVAMGPEDWAARHRECSGRNRQGTHPTERPAVPGVRVACHGYRSWGGLSICRGRRRPSRRRGKRMRRPQNYLKDCSPPRKRPVAIRRPEGRNRSGAKNTDRTRTFA